MYDNADSDRFPDNIPCSDEMYDNADSDRYPDNIPCSDDMIV
jgi:hypothetical protein